MKGFSLIEILITIAILGTISAILLIASAPAINQYELSRVTRGLASHIEKARTQAVYSKEGERWGVRLFSNRAVIFPGNTYTEGGSMNEEYEFGNRVVIATTTLTMSTSTISFDRISGRANNPGSIKLWLQSATTSSSTISIQRTGIIEIR